MRDFWKKCLLKARSALTSKASDPPARSHRNRELAKHDINAQQECPLFSKLSAELRIPIYEAVLTDRDRLLHICMNRREGKEKRTVRPVAHIWCTDQESPFPPWQHACFGESVEDLAYETVFCSRSTTTTDDQLLSLLLSCRLVYNEAFPILYRGNTFQFRGAPGLSAFTSSISTFHWHFVSHVQISTLHSWDAPPLWAEDRWPPEGQESWEDCCKQLEDLPHLQSLRLDITFQHYDKPPVPQLTDTTAINALKPLKDIKAKLFEVELNFEPSQELWNRLGHVNFTVVVKQREQNTEVFGYQPRLKIGDFD
ncbi:hypothetical protein BDV95DRAFT_180536 [Massariosphaeria phaeospora]|uniref:DUF7730 domain-containing protein n=1 Tax=Massariosphaeria phaeospora TaxID=100035 RepID=A0A7C8I0J6_9PLEO|nr:hypothetical protein BDV95DRAFT_180536 [Massariosphaeria phaeospora]